MSETKDKTAQPGEPKQWQPPADVTEQASEPARPKEYGGRENGLEPTRYGDWEKNGRCIDF